MGWLRRAAGVDWDLVRQVAEQVRGGAMTGHYDEPAELLLRDVHYSGDQRYPMQPLEDTGGCEQMSELLVDTLDALGVRARTVYGWFCPEGFSFDTGEAEPKGYTFEHVWAEVGGKIVDITGDQFNDKLEAPMPRVYIADADPRYYESRG